LAVLLIGLVPYWLRRHGRRVADVPPTNPTGTAEPGETAEAGPDVSTPSPPGEAGDGNRFASLIGFLAGPLAAPGGSLFFPQRSSTDAAIVDEVFYFILIVSVIFFAIIVSVMLLFVIKYRRRTEELPEKSPSHSNALEAVWTVIPTILVAVIFVWGFFGYMEMRQAPDDSYEIQVVAKKWAWSFMYPNGHIEADLHVPVDRPIRLVMTSDDVIHSLYIPAFRLKMDVVPGRYNRTWFQATETGDYDLFCAEYCGTQHSTMLAKVVVHPSGEFEKWLEEAANFLQRMSPEEGGAVLYQRRGCAQCHSIDGSAKAGGGPSFKGVFGTQQALTTGEEITVDENYIRESILEPQAKVRGGYKPVMPTYRGQLKEEEIRAIIAYIKSLK
jgi:cytochrome c oxidase subunit 2